METRGSQKQEATRASETGGNNLRNDDEGTWSLKINGCWGTKDFAYASANMPDTKTQAEGTPCSLELQPNSVKGVGVYIRENSEHNLRCVYEKYMPREGLGVLQVQHGQSLDMCNRVI